MYWLANERINQHDLESCLTRAKDLAHPNEAGKEFCSEVVQEISRLPRNVRKPFKSLTSGSLGRLLLLDIGISWITTTITSLYQYHDQKFITYTVTALVMRIHEEKGDRHHATRHNLWKDPLYRRLHPVLSKITSSIWLNIVNVRKETLNLPLELRNICLVGHHLDEEDFVEAVARLNNPSRGRLVVISTDYMLGNLTLWLLYHYDGAFRVVVGGDIVYDEVQGHSECEIELRVKFRCKTDRECQETRNSFRMTEQIAGSWGDFFEGIPKPTPSAGCQSPVRRNLCSFDETRFSGLNTIQSRIRMVAWDLTWWLCSLQVKPCQSNSAGIAYKINLGRRGADERPINFVTLLRRSPGMLQLPWAPETSQSSMPEDAVNIWNPEAFAKARNQLDGTQEVDKDSLSAKVAREALVRRCYPELNDLLVAAKSKCHCLGCKHGYDTDTKQLKYGCLMFYTYSAVLALLAHSIADAFGAKDISGSQETVLQASSSDPDIYHVERILVDVAQHSRIVWQTWFEVAAHVFLGHRYANVGASAQGNGVMQADNSMTVAIQHGELALVAPWIDLSIRIIPQGSFDFLPVHGRLCVPVTAKPTSTSDYQTLCTDFAIIKTERTDPTEDASEEPQDESCQILVENKSHEIQIDSIMYPTSDEGHYTLMTRVRAGRFSRLIDPCLTATMQANHFDRLYAQPCQHEQGETLGNNSTGVHAVEPAFSFDKLLGKWPCYPLDRIHMSATLETYLEYNIALGLADMGIVIVNGNGCCQNCAAAQLFQSKTRARSKVGRFLINVAEHMREGHADDQAVNRICL